ncbi:hypothetical protein JMJ77_0014611 [Colletotrichum scovillei]|uniref:Uncharacterized protein n=1 Tax=Colletotrichum scovillei TaxID=1209932 RepID=A0A9P7UHN9_9PEZI|nr:hypothetical protein JMJ77_0014611 [Colletotrichum scovillei]KAG7066150.1 hypothetical protein JMJ78_0012886 [Colletotrichum scovillei]KAG7068749.1 hypothetical protein JMJ76_0008428 [Colletotrichum scovillei]
MQQNEEQRLASSILSTSVNGSNNNTTYAAPSPDYASVQYPTSIQQAVFAKVAAKTVRSQETTIDTKEHEALPATNWPTPTSPALPCHPDPVHPSIFGLVLCASSLHCTSTRAPKHIRRDGILCLSSAAAQDWSITLRLRTMQSSSSMQYSLLCHSPKAKASPPRGPDLAEEKSD